MPSCIKHRIFKQLDRIFYQFGASDQILCTLDTADFGDQDVLKGSVWFENQPKSVRF